MLSELAPAGRGSQDACLRNLVFTLSTVERARVHGYMVNPLIWYIFAWSTRCYGQPAYTVNFNWTKPLTI